MSQACPCGAPLGIAALATRVGAISVEQVGSGRAVERCLRCAEIDERASVSDASTAGGSGSPAKQAPSRTARRR